MILWTIQPFSWWTSLKENGRITVDLVLGFLNKVSNILLEFTAVTRYLIPLERGTEDVAHKPVYYHTFFE